MGRWGLASTTRLPARCIGLPGRREVWLDIMKMFSVLAPNRTSDYSIRVYGPECGRRTKCCNKQSGREIGIEPPGESRTAFSRELLPMGTPPLHLYAMLRNETVSRRICDAPRKTLNDRPFTSILFASWECRTCSRERSHRQGCASGVSDDGPCDGHCSVRAS
ncbi:hypothetical protein BD413DRAFT_513699 [Trametes elegans]|nr:hypothetical protein BD413DRAFT_513699 [Trametes elegans]